MTDAQRRAFSEQSEKTKVDPTPAQQAHRVRVVEDKALKRAAARVWTKDEVAAQERAVELLLTEAINDSAICSALKAKWNVGATRAKKLIVRVRGRWIEESQVNAHANKVEAERRLTSGIHEARKDRNWSAVASFERTLAGIQGTLEPMRIDVNVRKSGAVAEIVAAMSGDELEALLKEMDERDQIYDKWRAGLLPPPPPAFDVVGEVVAEEPGLKLNGAGGK